MNMKKLAEIEEEGKRIFLAEQTDNVKLVLDSLLDFRVSGNKERLYEIKLFFHTLKGSAGIFKYKELSIIAERMDEYLSEIKGQIDYSHKLFSFILEGIAQTKFELSALNYDKFSFKVEHKNIQLQEDNNIDEFNTEYIYTIDCNKILCVDDDTTILRTLQNALETLGYHVRCIENPLLAAQVVKQFEPDLLIFDVMMPEITGIELLKQLRNENVSTPTVFLSSTDEKDTKHKAFENGASDYVLKPFDIEEFTSRLERVAKEVIEHKKSIFLDSTTGAYLLPLFNINFSIAKRRYIISREKFCVALIDIGFQKIVDTEGSSKGNFALKLVYTELKNHLRATDQIYKSNTNQFVILFSNTFINRGFALLKQLLNQIDTRKKTNAEDFSNININIGLAEFNENENNISILDHCNEARISNLKNNISVYKKEKLEVDEASEKNSNNENQNKGTILIIDDSMSLVHMLKSYFENLNFKVVSASNGVKGLLKCRTIRPDIVILDLMMPELDGFEVIKKIRTDSVLFKTQIIVVTSFSKRDYISRCISLGVNNILIKPFSILELDARLKSINF